MDVTDIEDNELLQFTVFHNSPAKPHLPVAHMDLDIATLREHFDKGGSDRRRFEEKFLAGWTPHRSQRFPPGANGLSFGRGLRFTPIFFR